MKVLQEKKPVRDIDKFLKLLSDNNILDDGITRGRVYVQMPVKDV